MHPILVAAVVGYFLLSKRGPVSANGASAGYVGASQPPRWQSANGTQQQQQQKSQGGGKMPSFGSLPATATPHATSSGFAPIDAFGTPQAEDALQSAIDQWNLYNSDVTPQEFGLGNQLTDVQAFGTEGAAAVEQSNWDTAFEGAGSGSSVVLDSGAADTTAYSSNDYMGGGSDDYSGGYDAGYDGFY